MIVMIIVYLAPLLPAHQFYKPTIKVSNGGPWGDWGTMEKCLPGTVAKGFDLKVEPFQGVGDDTAVNGIRLHCVRWQFPHNEMNITSTVEKWGKWSATKWCPYGFLTTFSLRVEPPQQMGDDTAANNIKFKCSDGEVLEGVGLSWGSYGNWSKTCRYGICGIKTKIEKYREGQDNTALNDVQFDCCQKTILLMACSHEYS